jgi:hypothetical protein
MATPRFDAVFRSNLTPHGALGVKRRRTCQTTKARVYVRTGRGEEQPADKERAQNAIKTEQGHMPAQPVIKKPEGK